MPHFSDTNSHSSRQPPDEPAQRSGPWIPATFDLEDMYSGIPGWMPRTLITRPGASDAQPEPVTWNGWDCPHFEKAAADLIVRQHNEQVQTLARESGRVYPQDLLARYDADTDSYHFFIINGYDQNEGRYTGEWETYSGMTVEVEPGYSLYLYPVGAWGWLWERTDG